MAISPKAKTADQVMDPSDQLDFVYDFAELETGDTITAFTVTAEPSSADLGLLIGSGARAPVLVSTVASGLTTYGIQFWLTIDVTKQDNAPIFDQGRLMGAIIRVTTSSTRVYERTLAVVVANR